MITASEILDRAGVELDMHGWHQGSLTDHETGAVCAMGALHKAKISLVGISTDGWQLAYTVAIKALREEIGTYTIPTWNDDPSRTVEDVKLALKFAAEEVRT